MSAQAMIFPSTQVGLPKETLYELPPQMADGSRAYSAHIAPDGITTVTGPAPTATSFAANLPGLVNQAFTSQQVSFTLPSGQSPSTFLDTTATSLSFRLTWTVSTASSVTNGFCQLNGGASSFFDSLQLVSNNTPLENINGYGQICQMSIASLCNYAERYGALTFAGLDTNGASGIDLAHTAVSTYYYSFTIPLMSLIGQNNNSGKWLPIGLINNLQLIMTTAALLPVATSCTAVATAAVFGAPVLDQFSLNLKYIDITSQASNVIMNSLKGGKIYIKASTYTNSNVSVANGSAGAVSLLLQIRNSSVKSLFFYQAIAPTAACPNGVYDAVNNGGASKCQVVIGGSRFPQRELSPSVRPSECLHNLQQAWGLGGDWSRFGGVLTRESYGATIPSLPTNPDNSLVVPASIARAAPSGSDTGSQYVVKFPNQHYLGVDLEKSSSVLFQGVNTRSTPPFIEYNFQVATTSAATLYGWGLSDVVMEIDAVSKQIVAYI
jgi:hypothetical protein